MSIALQSRPVGKQAGYRVIPSKVSRDAEPFTLDQELEPFGRWVGQPIWVPPKDASRELAQTMLQQHGLLASKQACWDTIIREHRAQFTQVREMEMEKASIRLPQGRLFVTITEQRRFSEITDRVPACVQTRLEEFLDGPGKRAGVKVYYLKPLCVEVDDKLIFTSGEDVQAAITAIQQEVFSAYRRMYPGLRARQGMSLAADVGLYVPREILKLAVERKRRAIDAYQARLEFNRRKTALRAAKVHRRLRTDGCTFDDMLALTNPLERDDVIEQFSVEHQLSRAQRQRLLQATAVTLPWFVALSLSAGYLTSVALTATPPLVACDPAFVAEMPHAPGVLFKIGHFDEIGGVTHIEI